MLARGLIRAKGQLSDTPREPIGRSGEIGPLQHRDCLEAGALHYEDGATQGAGYDGSGRLGGLHHPGRETEKVNIDVGGLGIGVYDRLIEQGFDTSLVNAVNFDGKPIEPPPLDENGKPAGGPANRRAELWPNLKKALQGRFSIPDSDSLHADLTSVGYKYMGDRRLLLEAKDDMRKRGMPSPDEGDAVVLCFTEPEGSPFPRSNGNFNRTHQ